MHKKFAILLLTFFALFVIALNYEFFYSKILGYGTLGSINVSIEGKLGGKLLLVYDPVIQFGQIERIHTEFINIGSLPVTAKIENRIHKYANGTLKIIAYYYDYSVPLNPGMRRWYDVNFTPPDAGLYYIQARVPYETKVAETWAAFLVYYPPNIIMLPGPSAPTGGPGGIIVPAVGLPDMSLTYPDKVKAYIGGTTTASIIIQNTGGTVLRNLRLYTSSTNSVDIGTSPKQISAIGLNSSSLFLISIFVPSTTSEGEYPLDFEISSDQTKQTGKIKIEVVSSLVSEDEEIRQRILNYEFLISEIESEIFSASNQGFDLTLPSRALEQAKLSLGKAKYYYELGKFDEAKKELENVRKSLEEAVLQLASSTLYIYKPAAYSPLLILLLIIIIITIIILPYYYKRKERRPKMLRELGETETETGK
jgi:hypothetical protein